MPVSTNILVNPSILQVLARNLSCSIILAALMCINLAIYLILYNDKISAHNKFYEFVNWCNQLAIHFASLVYTNFIVKKPKILKSLNLCTLRYFNTFKIPNLTVQFLIYSFYLLFTFVTLLWIVSLCIYTQRKGTRHTPTINYYVVIFHL